MNQHGSLGLNTTSTTSTILLCVTFPLIAGSLLELLLISRSIVREDLAWGVHIAMREHGHRRCRLGPS